MIPSNPSLTLVRLHEENIQVGDYMILGEITRLLQDRSNTSLVVGEDVHLRYLMISINSIIKLQRQDMAFWSRTILHIDPTLYIRSVKNEDARIVTNRTRSRGRILWRGIHLRHNIVIIITVHLIKYEHQPHCKRTVEPRL